MMKQTTTATLLLSFLAIGASVGDVAAHGVRKKGRGGKRRKGRGGKKGMSMSMGDSCDVSGAAFCNSGRVACRAPLEGCNEYTDNTDPLVMNILDTDGCLAFCETYMESDDYFVQFTPSTSGAEFNGCQCFEACADFRDVANTPGIFPVLFAVGDTACDYFDDPMGEVCEDTVFTACSVPNQDCVGSPDTFFTDTVEITPQRCADSCFGVGGSFFSIGQPEASVFVCRCYAACQQAEATPGFDLFVLDDDTDTCPDSCPAADSACTERGWTCDDKGIVCDGFTRRLVFDLLPEDDKRRQLRSLQNSPIELPCPSQSNQVLTCTECCNGRRSLQAEPNEDKGPWMHPHVKTETSSLATSMELVADDPGIWKISNFFSEETIDKLIAAVERAGDDLELFGQCAGAPHSHLDEKECYRLSPDSSHIDDADLIHFVMDHLATLWPHAQELEQRDYMYAQRTKPGCDATEIHRDKNHGSMSSATTTTVLYLSEGAGVYFPHLDTVVSPQKGMVVTWINVHLDGEHNYKANHGIQATPDHFEFDRLALTFRTNLSEQECEEAALASKEAL
ncbi:MAG: hypothetical protein SGARI_000781 [Bacillariaceae sp.]